MEYIIQCEEIEEFNAQSNILNSQINALGHYSESLYGE